MKGVCAPRRAGARPGLTTKTSQPVRCQTVEHTRDTRKSAVSFLLFRNFFREYSRRE